MMRVHVEFGEQYLNGIDFLRPAALIVRHHHERYDGSGYPDGLRGQNIPLGSRILTIADALESLTSHQQYRAARSMHEAIEEIGRWSGRQFDPLLVTNFVRVSGDTWSQIREQAETSSLKPMTTDFRQEPGLPAVV
jgi:response regulator RpfG family c-di-GMP phosphodiesterase